MNRSDADRENARRDREIRRLERAGEPVPPELRERAGAAAPPTPAPAGPSAYVPPPAPVVPPAPVDVGREGSDVHGVNVEPHTLDPGAPQAQGAPADPAYHTDEHPIYHTDEHDLPAGTPLHAPIVTPPPPSVAATAGRPVRRRRGRRIAVISVLALLGVAIAWFAISLTQPFTGKGSGRVVVTVPAGASTSQIGDLLAKEGVVDSAFFFGLRARMDGTKLRSGRYTLLKGMSYGDALIALSTVPAAPKTVSITIPEGLSRREISPRTSAAGLSGNYVRATASSPRLHPSAYGAPRGTRNLEGFLFPATYELKPGAKVNALVNDQLRTFRQRFATIDMRSAKHKNLTGYDIITIASMIDRETAYPKDRAKIAAVIYNRLHQGIPLGIDATTRYEFHNWTKPLKQSELSSPSKYNTRTHKGLPPTPIGNPGMASLRAAAHPAAGSYLFYVVKPCGNGASAFSSTNAQFLKDVAAYNAARAKNGGNDPSTCKKK